ncbi:hypothetical protein LTR56_006640 [Elasticomyces elasticus]|nr:hypothetical protein LTR22_012805 [Elasticomyces elasticus]KAK3649741.1 hypothetical protein LTR56_006640 [Elasticomyces elasticus]KAK4918076.1 hypothetical protein LTR49_014080 [Elasticomyces elasticus]KAK5757425.1 hypothetical protein LTS12_012508 [Elasticomyces elasticus]
MGNIISKQEIERPFVNAARAVLRRKWIWEGFVKLLHTLKDVVGLGSQEAIGTSQTVPSSPESPSPKPPSPKPPSTIPPASPSPDDEAAAADAEAEKIREALAKSLKFNAYDKYASRTRNETAAAEDKAEKSKDGSRKPKDDSKTPKEDASKPTTQAPVDDDYGNEVAKHVRSSLMAALPQSHKSGLMRPQSPVDEESSDSTNPDTASLSKVGRKELPPRNEERQAEQDQTFANYNKWDPKFYEGLCLDKLSIRLINIRAGLLDDDLSVDMQVCPLEEITGRYEALSYVWGKADLEQHISVNDTKVPINPNLYSALKSLRKPNAPRRLWTDAICVNQQSVAERSREVEKMGEIYRRAKTVDLFLGAPSPSKPTSIDRLFKFLNRDDPGHAASRFDEAGLAGINEICEKDQLNVRDVCIGFDEACRQPWWSRIWTLQEFYLATAEPVWYWGSAHASNASLKRDFDLLTKLAEHVLTSGDARVSVALRSTVAGLTGSITFDIQRIWDLVSRRQLTHGFDNPRRLYRDLTARATDPHDFVYGLRAIFDPVFGKVFVPDYFMPTEVLFACLAVFLIQFECWGDVLWWYPRHYLAGGALIPSWLPDFTRHIVLHQLDVRPLDWDTEEELAPRMVVLDHKLIAEGYIVDKVYGHRHIDESDGEKILQELWQFDHCMNHNYEWHEDILKDVAPGDQWLKVFFDMYGDYYARLNHFVPAFRGKLLQSTMGPEHRDRLPQQIAACLPCWDLLQWHALKVTTPGLAEALGQEADSGQAGYLENVFSLRMRAVFRRTLANFFIGSCIFDWNHLSVWLRRFANATQWSRMNSTYWSGCREPIPTRMETRAKAISDAYSGYENEIMSEVMRVSWCYSFYYTFLAYIILLDCDDHADLESIILGLQTAGGKLRSDYHTTTTAQISELALKVPSIAARLDHYKTVIDLFRGRYLIWTDGGFRGISCPGVKTCCDEKSYVMIIDGLSFPMVVNQYDKATNEGRLAGCALIRGVGMTNKDAASTTLPSGYARGKKTTFSFR